VPAQISNNDDVLEATRDVDAARVDAFVWDAQIVLHSLGAAAAQGLPICVYAMKKRIFPFELGIGLGRDAAPDVVAALQAALGRLDERGVRRDLRYQFLEGLNQYVGVPTCPAAAQGLTAGQTAGVYLVPAAVFGAIVLGGALAWGWRAWRARRRGRAAAGRSASAPAGRPTGAYYGAASAPSGAAYPKPVHFPIV
jgi:hypothetical protein